MENLKFKKVESTDEIDKVVVLADNIWNEHYASLISKDQIDYMLEKFQSTDAISKAINEGALDYYLVCENDVPIGYIGINIANNKLFLSKFYLLSSSRGKGYGRDTMNFIVKTANENKANSIWLTCNKNNKSLKQYSSLGFKVINSQESDIGNGYVMDDYVLEKTI